MDLRYYAETNLLSFDYLNGVELKHFPDSYVHVCDEPIDRENWIPDDKKRLILYGDKADIFVSEKGLHTIINVNVDVPLVYVLICVVLMLESKDVYALLAKKDSPLWKWNFKHAVRKNLEKHDPDEWLIGAMIIGSRLHDTCISTLTRALNQIEFVERMAISLEHENRCALAIYMRFLVKILKTNEKKCDFIEVLTDYLDADTDREKLLDDYCNLAEMTRNNGPWI